MTNRELAARFLTALESGEDARALRAELAEAAIAAGDELRRQGEQLIEHAHEVQSGGPHAWRRAIELAEALGAADGDSDAGAGETSGGVQ